jgi:hypothetical protein
MASTLGQLGDDLLGRVVTFLELSDERGVPLDRLLPGFEFWPNVLSVPICVLWGRCVLEICFSDRRRKRSAISYFLGEDSSVKMTLRPAARRHVLFASSTPFCCRGF